MTPWVLRLLIANVAVFLLEGAAPSTREFALIPALMFARPWTAITYAFLHQNFSHLFWNMFGLFIFGPRLEAHIGSSKFVGLYLVSAVAAALLSFVLTPYTQIVGASGAVIGVSAGFARYWPREMLYIFGVLPVPAWLAIGGYIAWNVYRGLAGGGDTAYFAHVGGFIGGYVYLIIIDRVSGRRAAQFARRVRSSIPPISKANMQKWSRIDREALHPVNRAEYDRIMEKIRDEGIASLTDLERSFLDRFAER